MDFFDEMLADSLGVKIQDYITVIESFSEARMEAVILGLMSGNEKSFNTAKRCFEMQRERI